MPKQDPDMFSIGVDLGGSHLAVGLLDALGNLHAHRETTVDFLASPEVTLRLVAENIKQIKDNRANVCGIGIGLPGNHDTQKGVCRFSPNLPKWHNVEVVSYLSSAVKLPVYMLNDVRVATLGELHFGAGKSVRNLVMIAIGTGIGGGVVIDRKLIVGKDEGAGEVGHITINPLGPHCNCGNRGCMEAIASGPAIAAKGAEAVIRKRPTKLREKVKALEEMSAEIVAEAAQEGDLVALQIFEEAGRAIGIGISTLAVALNPDYFIIGGGVALAGEPLFAPIREEISQRAHILPPGAVSVVPAALGPQAGLIGAATYAFLKSNVHIA